MSNRSARAWRIAAVTACGVGLVGVGLLGVGAYLADSYRDRALPGTSVAGIDATGMNRAQLAVALTSARKGIEVSLSDGESTAKASADDLGLAYDTDATVDRLLAAKRGESIVAAVNPSVKESVDAIADYDLATLQKYLDSTFPDSTTAPVDATVAYDAASGEFVATAAKDGKHIDATSLAPLLAELAQKPRAAEAKLTVVTDPPAISDEAAAKAVKALNATVNAGYALMQDGEAVYTVEPAEIASWISVEPDAAAGVIGYTVDTEAIADFTVGTIEPAVHRDAQTLKRAVDEDGALLRVDQDGVDGRDLADPAAVQAALAKAVADGSGITLEPEWTVTEHETETVVEKPHWIDVNVTTQTATAYEGKTAVKTFLVSTGKVSTPTTLGTFEVWYKTEVQDMKGDRQPDGSYGYIAKNVRWNSFFHNSEAFHSATWHNNFGHRMSHGCVNMRPEDAKWIYDFAPIGTKVVVHE